MEQWFKIVSTHFPSSPSAGKSPMRISKLDPDELVRITILIRKKDGISHQEFDKYWSTEHLSIWLSIPIVRENIVKYSQFHVDDDFRKQNEHLPFACYDGAVEMWAECREDLMAVFANEDYLDIVVPDEKKILKREETVMLLGWESPKWAARKGS